MRLQTEVTEPFYKKFGARNISSLNPKNSMFEYMIIDTPSVVGELPLELADDFDYAAVGKNSPFEAGNCAAVGGVSPFEEKERE